MPAQHHIDNEKKLLITRWEGDAEELPCTEALQEYQRSIQSNPDYLGYNEIFDTCGANRIKVSISGLIRIGRIASKTDHLFTDKKLAIVVRSNVAFSILQMYESYRNIGITSPKKIRIFKSFEKATEWAREDLKQTV